VAYDGRTLHELAKAAHGMGRRFRTPRAKPRFLLQEAL